MKLVSGPSWAGPLCPYFLYTSFENKIVLLFHVFKIQSWVDREGGLDLREDLGEEEVNMFKNILWEILKKT